MARRRGKGEGSIFKRKDGTWQGAVTVGYTDAGKQKRRTVYGKTQREAREKIDALKHQLDSGTFVDTESSLGLYLSHWLKHQERHVKQSTSDGYRYNIEKYINPRLGEIRLSKLTPLAIQVALGDIADQVGTRTSNLCRGVLFTALRQAVRWRLLPHNPVEGVIAAKQEKQEMHLWTPAQTATFLETAKQHRLYPLFYLAISTGLRSGELLGLRWADLEGNALTIRRTLITRSGEPRISTPKTDKGVRRVTLSPNALAVLALHRERQLVERKALGDAWDDNDHVFVSEVGTLLNARNVTRISHDLQEKARQKWREELKNNLTGEALAQNLDKLERGEILPRLRLHDMRHLNVSLRRKLGQDAKLIADQVGHADPAFTVRLYAHLFEDERQAAGVNLEAALASDEPVDNRGSDEEDAAELDKPEANREGSG